jgi:hypothetical protein
VWRKQFPVDTQKLCQNSICTPGTLDKSIELRVTSLFGKSSEKLHQKAYPCAVVSIRRDPTKQAHRADRADRVTHAQAVTAKPDYPGNLGNLGNLGNPESCSTGCSGTCQSRVQKPAMHGSDYPAIAGAFNHKPGKTRRPA